MAGIGQQLVVIDLGDEGDAVGIAPRHGTEHPQGGSHTIAAALDGQLADGGGVEEQRVGREGGAGRMFHALVHRQQGQVAGAGQPASVEQKLQVTHDRR
jgi:hypothetical protein